MIINDLNHIQTAEKNVCGGFTFGPSSVTKVGFNLGVVTNLTSFSQVIGNFAGAEADADALGPNSSTSAVSITTTVAGVGSSSSATSISASNGHGFIYRKY